jgi:hypothetical protein
LIENIAISPVFSFSLKAKNNVLMYDTIYEAPYIFYKKNLYCSARTVLRLKKYCKMSIDENKHFK